MSSLQGVDSPQPSLPDLPGSRLIFPRALSPTTPEGLMAARTRCFATSMSGFTLVGRLATFVFLSRPNRVHLRYGSRVRLTGPRQPDHSVSRRVGYMLNGQLTW
jgi:hypothetical protein